MKEIKIKIAQLLKGLTLIIKPYLWLGWLKNPMLMISNTISLSQWISSQDKHDILNDFYAFKRDYSKRYKLYSYVIDKFGINESAFDYLEFGVCEGESVRWWVANNKDKDNCFYGFDTFEGLPEKWGTFNKGDMLANIPEIDDERVKFFKGLFQDTLPEFLAAYPMNNGKRKIIHLDADLFSSTLYALTSLAPYMKKGDILIFDEFNVPRHEYYAYKCFTEAFYIKTKLIAAVNNYYQVALIITD